MERRLSKKDLMELYGVDRVTIEDLIDSPKKGLFNYYISISKMRFLVTGEILFP